MVGRAKDVTDAELAVLQVLWERGSTAIRDITAVVYPHDVETQYSTVKRLLTRLEGKGYVGRDRSEAVHKYEAIVDRDELVGRRLEALASSLCEGSISPLLTHLANSERLTREQQDTLRSLIGELAEHEQGGAKTPKSKRRRKN